MDEPSIRHRSTLKHHYTMTSNVLLFGYKQLSDSEKLTYQAIDSFDWSDGKGKRKGFAFPSARTLAQLRGVDRRTIFRHFGALERVGLLTRESRPGHPTLLWIEEPSTDESARYLSTIPTGRDADVAPTRDADVAPTRDADVAPLLKESEESSQSKTKPLNAAKAFEGERGGRQFLSADERAKREWLANHMVSELGDPHSLAFYRKVARETPETRIFEALSSTRTVRREGTLTGKPGAYFVALLRGERSNEQQVPSQDLANWPILRRQKRP